METNLLTVISIILLFATSCNKQQYEIQITDFGNAPTLSPSVAIFGAYS
ncbi:hypothetical protein [Parabacteroides chinchillae]|nr:hypothetical protein [Parabacteroides chinchillae]